MSEPRRLTRSGGHVQELLESASLDRGSEASRRRALELSTTAGAFARQAEAPPEPRHVASLPRAIAKWVALGAAAGGLLALGASQLSKTHNPSPADGGQLLSAPVSAPVAASPASSPDIAAEPLVPRSAAPPSASVGDAAPAPLLEAARLAIRRGDYASALESLNAYDRAHPHGPFAAESLALRIRAVKRSGKAEEARSLTSEFQQKFPNHSLLEDRDGRAP